jgi:peptidoglycan/LPS O-acetylase OafA/YrhL
MTAADVAKAAEDAPAPTSAGERKFRPDIEGLRAIAVTVVVLFHAGILYINGGFVGVDVFFVISGFLITRLLVAEHEARNTLSISGFYARRVRRIIPAATLVLVVVVLASYHWLGFLVGDGVATDARWSAVFLANIHFAGAGTQYFNAFKPYSPLQHMWSLGVEEQFYLVWPVVILLTAAVGRRYALRTRLGAVLLTITAASFVWSVTETHTNPIWAYFSPFTRGWELAVGGLVAVWSPALARALSKLAPVLSNVGLVAVIASAFALNSSTPYPGAAAAWPVLATACVIAGGSMQAGAFSERLLALPPVQWVGKRSYSIYLWHWPLLIIPAEYAGTSLILWKNIVWVGIAVIAAAVTYRLVENPIRQSRYLADRPALSLGMGLASSPRCSSLQHS